MASVRLKQCREPPCADFSWLKTEGITSQPFAHRSRPEMELPRTLAALVSSRVARNEEPFLVAICGWADTGKSTLAAQLRAALTAGGVESESISTDDFLRDRVERNALGISGYDVRSLDASDLHEAIARFQRRQSFTVQPYDNRTGTRSRQPRTVFPAKVLVVEGIHSLHASVADQMGLKVFIDSDEATLRQMRYRANMLKRGMTAEDAAARISSEWEDYNIFVRPRMAVSDLVVRVDEHFVYRSREGGAGIARLEPAEA